MNMNVHHLYVHVNSLIIADFGNSINGMRDGRQGRGDGHGDIHKYINKKYRYKAQGMGLRALRYDPTSKVQGTRFGQACATENIGKRIDKANRSRSNR